MRVVASCGGSKGEIMGNAKRAGTARVAKGSAVGSGSEGGARRATAWMPVWCVVGLVGAQAWMPAVGLVADKYRSSAFSIDELAPLLLSYLASLAVVSALFAVLRMRSQPSKGTYGVLAGAAFSCIGALLLHLLDGMAPDRVAFLFSLSGALLGAGNGLMALVWSSAIARLPGPAQAGSSVAVVLGCCSLAAFAQAVGANALLLGATMALAVSSALCFVLAASRGDVVELPAPQKGIGSAYVRVGAAMGCFGFLFAMMIMQFVIAPHGRASAFTWAYGYAGVLAAVVFLVLVRVVRSSWDFLFALRFVAVPLIVAFYPFDTGTDFSVKFALCFSTLALWCFCTIVPGVLREAADVLHAPVYVMASVGVGGLCGGAAVGYCLAGVIEAVGPTTNYFIKITVILAMVLGLLGTNIVVTKGGLVRIFRKAAVATGSTTESDSFLEEKAALVSRCYGLTSRESDVLRILAKGHGLGRVQEELFISEGTAITHRRHIYQKLDVHAKSELIDLVARADEACEED